MGDLTFGSTPIHTMDYMLARWDSFACFLTDGRICLSNNAAERALRGIAIGRKAWLFAAFGRGGERAALIYSLIATAKLNVAAMLSPRREWEHGSQTTSLVGTYVHGMLIDLAPRMSADDAGDASGSMLLSLAV